MAQVAEMEPGLENDVKTLQEKVVLNSITALVAYGRLTNEQRETIANNPEHRQHVCGTASVLLASLPGILDLIRRVRPKATAPEIVGLVVSALAPLLDADAQAVSDAINQGIHDIPKSGCSGHWVH